MADLQRPYLTTDQLASLEGEGTEVNGITVNAGAVQTGTVALTIPTLAAPGSSAPGDTVTTGTAATTVHSDHKHGREAWGVAGDIAVPAAAASAGATGHVADAGHVHGGVGQPGGVAGPLGSDGTLPPAQAPNAIVEVAVTGTTILTSSAFGKYHVCSGTAANYTVTLPDATGQTGKLIAFRMSGALTKLVTLATTGGQTIDGATDGATTRVMWACETAVLESDGANWVKLSGKSIPMECQLHLSADTSYSSGAVHQILYDVVDLDNTGRMADLANNRIQILRPGNVVVDSLTYYSNLPLAGRCVAFPFKTTTVTGFSQWETAGASGGYPTVGGSVPLLGVTASDWLIVQILNISGGNQVVVGTGNTHSFMWVREDSPW